MKVIDRILYKLDDLILVVIEPLLIDEDYYIYARVEVREIISNLAKAAGLATMISTMRPDRGPDIDNVDEYVRNTTARAFAVVASALGIPSLLANLNLKVGLVHLYLLTFEFIHYSLLFLFRLSAKVRNRGKLAIQA